MKKNIQTIKDALVKAAHGDHTGRPSINALCQKVTKAIQEDPRWDTDSHGQPEGSAGDREPYCYDCTVPDDKGRMHAIINTDENKTVKHGFTFDGENVVLDPGASEETECTPVYAASKENFLGFIKAAGTADGGKKAVATKKGDAASAASQAAHDASATAHESGSDEDHEAAKAAHEAASNAHKVAMVAQAKAGNTEAATDHAKAMAAHDACADAHCRKDSEAVEAAGTDYVGKFVKAGGPGSGPRKGGGKAHTPEETMSAIEKAKQADEEAKDASHTAEKATGNEAKAMAHMNAHKAWMKSSRAHMDAIEAGVTGQGHGDASYAANQKAAEHLEASREPYRAHIIEKHGYYGEKVPFKAATPKSKDQSVVEVPKGILRATEAAMEFSDLPTSSFMWMPIGQSTIQAEYDGKPARVTVNCDEAGFRAVKASFDRFMTRAKEMNEREPWVCVQHREDEATAWPKDFEFHDDGIYCKAEWTELGTRLVRGKTYRRFSPVFNTDADWVKAVDNGNGVLVFPEGVRGSASNPARVTGTSPKSVGSLTNWPAFKSILPVKANQADPQPATTKPAEQQKAEPTVMKLKFIKASSCGKYAAGTEHDLTPELAQPFIQAGEAAAPAIADRVIQLEAERVRQGETNTALVNQALLRATERGALPKNGADGKRHADTEAAFVKASGYLKNGVPVSDVCDIIDTMPVKAAGAGKEGLFVRASRSDERTPGGKIAVGDESIEEACEGILKAYEPMTTPVKGSMGLVRAGMMDEAIEKSRFIANKFNAVIRPVLDKGGDFALKDMVKAADTADPNGQLGTIATGILLMRDLGFLKAKLVPMQIGTTDLSAEPVKFNQQIITRYKTPPPVLTFKKGIGYTLNANDTTRTTSTVSTTDVPINMQQNKAVCVKFDNQLLGSTMRNLFGEQQAMQFYSLAKAINQHFIATLIAAAWKPVTDGNAALNPPQFNANQFNVPSLVAIKNKMTLAQIPDEGRHVLLHSFFHDILLQDSNILTASVIKAALQAQTNPNLTTFGNTELPELFGLDIHESQLFTDVPYVDSQWQPTVFGFAGTQASALFVSRVPNDYTEAFKDIPATAAIQVVTEPDSNLSMLFSKWVDNAAKETNAECALMYQAAQGHPGQGFLLKTAGGAQN